METSSPLESEGPGYKKGKKRFIYLPDIYLLSERTKYSQRQACGDTWKADQTKEVDKYQLDENQHILMSIDPMSAVAVPRIPLFQPCYTLPH
jgi:hypothetical protein